ncbi:MAG TPA: DUF5615 family PIN-like protein [Bryobacteraceae bacterium]|jgi:hypothetical protein|nr:DUF5615 family PIN-like protein [Bryobacteraceae bacterium]
MTEQEILAEYPDLHIEDIRECLRFAAVSAMERDLPLSLSHRLRFLIDNALSRDLARLLREAGHDAVHVRDYGASRAEHPMILDRAGRSPARSSTPTAVSVTSGIHKQIRFVVEFRGGPR